MNSLLRSPRILWSLAVAALASRAPSADAKGKAEHVVVVVWDGMRPDFITPQYTPALYELAQKGAFFRRHHSAYITSTEVNGTALATGMHPDHSGVMANVQYRPDLNWTTSYGTESIDAVRRGDLLSDGKYIETPTVAEILHDAGFPTIIAGAKPIALLHDRSARRDSDAARQSVTLFRGQTVPRAVLESLTRAPDIGAFPSPLPRPAATNAPTTVAAAAPAAVPESPAPGSRRGSGFTPDGSSGSSTPDSWTTRALTRGLWKKNVPAYTLLWLSEPDGAQHASAPGSEAALSALDSSDKNLAAVLKALEDKGVLETTDLFVVSDHGFSSVDRGTDVVEGLKKAKFTAGKQFENPEPGDVMVVNLGGSISFYVFEHDEAVIKRLVTYLQGTDFAGVIFSGLAVEGTFPLTEAHVNVSKGAPDILVSLRWSGDKNEFGAPGSIIAMEGRRGTGVHASLSRFDLHNTLVASGPDFKAGFVDELPSGNIDVAPTVLHILGVEPARPMDGRILFEAMTVGDYPAPKPVEQILQASRTLGFLEWQQHLKTIQVGYATYYDEGNGESRLK